MAVNWGMAGQGNNALAYFQLGRQLGGQIREGQLRKAVGQYLMGDQAALGRVMELDPSAGMQLQQRELQASAMRQKEQRGRVMEIARLFDGVNDEATYQQRLGVAARMGIDTTGAPTNFNPQWVEENRLIMSYAADKPEAISTFGKIATDEGYSPGTPDFNRRVTELVKADAIKTIPYVPGGGVAGYDSLSGKTSTIIAPNPGGAATGTPVGGGSPPQAAIDYLRKNPKLKAEFDAKYGQGAADRVLGGQPAGAGPFVP